MDVAEGVLDGDLRFRRTRSGGTANWSFHPFVLSMLMQLIFLKVSL